MGVGWVTLARSMLVSTCPQFFGRTGIFLLYSRVESWECLKLLSGPEEWQPLCLVHLLPMGLALATALPLCDCLAIAPSFESRTSVGWLA